MLKKKLQTDITMESQTNSEAYLLSGSSNTKIILDQPKFTIGRGLNNSYVLEDLKISRIHCAFEEKNGVWYISDQSSNGTLLNRNKIQPNVSQRLSGGDVITLTDCYEFVFVNMRNDSLDNIDLSAIEDVEITCTDYEVEVVTSDVVKIPDANRETSVSTKLSEQSLSNFAIVAVSNDHAYLAASNRQDIDPSAASENTETDSKQIEPVASTSSENNNQEEDIKEVAKSTVQAERIADTLEQVENELQCIICTELFIKATTLNCSHSFCKHCLEEWRKKNKNCPICRARIITANPTIVLDNFIAKILESAPNDVREKRQEVIGSREQLPVQEETIAGSDRVLRSRTATVEISSSEDDSYEEGDFTEFTDFEDYDEDDVTYNGVAGAYYGGYGQCFSCGDPGHWANGCPYR